MFVKRNQKVRNLFKEKSGILTSKDLQSIGLTHYAIKKLVDEDVIKRIKRGKYIHSEIEENELFLIQQIIPSGIFCLFTAATIYNYTTYIPNEYLLAVKGNHYPKLPEYPPVKIYYWRKKQYELGIESIEHDGSIIRIYDREKTVCDFIKLRNKMENNVVKEVLKSYLRSDEKNLSKLQRYSKDLRIESVLNNYLEILL